MQSKEQAPETQFHVDITLGRLKQLNQTERTLIGLFYYEELTVEEIAIILQRDKDQVQTDINNIFPKVFASPSRQEALGKMTSEVIG